jgi:branched-chain amino acid transport system permease protein
MTRARRTPGFWAGAVLAVALAVLVEGNYRGFVLALAAVYAGGVLSVSILMGWMGQVSLAQGSMMGIGAYAAYGLNRAGVPVLAAIPLAGLVALPLIVALGLAVVRFRSVDLLVGTLAVGMVGSGGLFRNLSLWLGPDSASGGSSRVVDMPRPEWFRSDADYLVVAVAVIVALIALVRVVERPMRLTFRAIRSDNLRAEAVGISVRGHRLAVFVLAQFVAAVTGGVLAGLVQSLSPAFFTLNFNYLLLSLAVLGGVASWPGAVLGGTIGALLPELARSDNLKVLEENLSLLYGAALILLLARRPDGIAGLVRAAVSRLRRTGTGQSSRANIEIVLPEADDDGSGDIVSFGNWAAGRNDRRPELSPRHLRDSVLVADALSINFGGVHALQDVSLRITEGEICAIVGPNGAGKSTLFNCLSGFLDPASGRIYHRYEDITEMAPYRRCQAGIGRTFQKSEAFSGLTVAENLLAAAHSRRAGTLARLFNTPKAREADADIVTATSKIMARFELTEYAGTLARDLPAGLLRLLEIGIALAGRPDVLLLDEPAAGCHEHERETLFREIGRLRTEGISVLLIDHDVPFVRALADHVYVLDFGQVIFDGPPEALEHDERVRRSYLGEELGNRPQEVTVAP